MIMKVFKGILYWIAQLTWGIIMNIIGMIAALCLLITGHKPKIFHYAVCFEFGENWGGVSLGGFFFCNKTSDAHVKFHEHGHGYQNIMFGVLFPFIIAIPSAIRCAYYNHLYEKNPAKYYTLPPYDSIWFEGMASRLGYKYCEKELIQIVRGQYYG